MNLLISVQGAGAVYTICLFLIVAIVVHGAKLARIGYRSLGKKLPSEPPKAKRKSAPEPVYYIVERKKKRAKTEYDPPRRIQFR